MISFSFSFLKSFLLFSIYSTITTYKNKNKNIKSILFRFFLHHGWHMYMFQLTQDWKNHEPLDDLSNIILRYFIKEPAQSSYRCHKYLSKEYEKYHQKISPKKVNNRISKLILADLIKEKKQAPGEKPKNNAKYFELTSVGIFYI